MQKTAGFPGKPAVFSLCQRANASSAAGEKTAFPTSSLRTGDRVTGVAIRFSTGKKKRSLNQEILVASLFYSSMPDPYEWGNEKDYQANRFKFSGFIRDRADDHQ